jgi:mRNA interferase MazF
MYKQGDILLVSIPYSDMTSMKKRPVLVLSNDYQTNEW